MSNSSPTNINVHTNITANAPRPLDSKTIVGVGQEYLNKDSIPSNYRFRGMRVYDITTKIEWELVPMTGNNININEFENAGTIGNTDAIHYWKNISFGATPMFFKNNIWLNENNINMSTSSGDVLLTAITFGEVKKVLWTITRSGGQQEISKKETFTKTFGAGNYIIKFEAFDIYGNSIAYNFTMTVTTVGVLGIETFTVAPSAGINNNTGVKRTYNFNLVTTEPIVADQLQTLNIEFNTQFSLPTSVSLINNNTFINGVTVLNANSLSINGTLITGLNNITLNTDTVFTLTLQKYQEQVLTATATYNSVNKIVVSGGTITYNQSTKQLSSTITLQAPYNTLSVVTGNFVINNITYNYIANIDKRTFNFLQTNININPGTYNISATMLQTVATGIGANTEIYNVVYPMTLSVAEPTYSVTITVTDNLPESLGGPDAIELPIISIYQNGVIIDEYSPQNGTQILNLPNGNYYVIISKDNYITSDPYYFTVNSIPQGFTIELEPDRSFENVFLQNCQPNQICTVNYGLVPHIKYEDDSEITYTIKLGNTVIEGPVTKTKLNDPNYYNKFTIGNYNGHTLHVTITSYYLDEQLSIAILGEIGGVVPKFGYLPIIDDPTTKNVSDIINEFFIDGVLLTNANILPITSPQEVLFESVFGFGTEGYNWFAFPGVAQTITEYADWGDSSWWPIGSYFYVASFPYGDGYYNLYIYKGRNSSGNTFGWPNIMPNIQIR